MVDLESLKAQHRRAEQRAHLLREIIETVLLTALVFLVVHTAVQTFKVYGPSMQPGLTTNELLLVNSTAYWFGGPQRGQIVVFHQHHMLANPDDLRNGCSADSGTNGKYMTCDLVKRVIALPGDTIEITATQVIVDGVQLKEPYIPIIAGETQSNTVVPLTKMAPNQYFVMGDNRMNSLDSRDYGPVNRANIVGRVVMVFYPFNQAHWLPNYSSVFAQVKQ